MSFNTHTFLNAILKTFLPFDYCNVLIELIIVANTTGADSMDKEDSTPPNPKHCQKMQVSVSRQNGCVTVVIPEHDSNIVVIDTLGFAQFEVHIHIIVCLGHIMFSKDMSDDEFIQFLKRKGLADIDCQKLRGIIATVV